MGATERGRRSVERAEAAMAAAGMKAVAPAARAALLWTLRRMVEAANAEDAKDGKGRRGRSAAPERVQPQPQGGGDAESVEALLSLGERAPWSRAEGRSRHDPNARPRGRLGGRAPSLRICRRRGRPWCGTRCSRSVTRVWRAGLRVGTARGGGGGGSGR